MNTRGSDIVERDVWIDGLCEGDVLADTYRLERELNAGGMGIVYEASHLRLPKRYAIKVLHPQIASRRMPLERFWREAQITGALGHQNIVEVFDFNVTQDGVPYMVLELLDGEDLGQRLNTVGALTLDEVTAILIQVADGLQAAHDAGVIHRDLKPGNIFMARIGGRYDVVKLLDFGISKILHECTLATQTGFALGTPEYMAPEQALAEGDELDARVDVFALSVILYCCLVGTHPFRCDTPIGSMYKVVHLEPEPVSRLRPELPRELDAVLADGMAKLPADRIASVRELRDRFVAAAKPAMLELLPTQAFEVGESTLIATPPMMDELVSTTPAGSRARSATPAEAGPSVDLGAKTSAPQNDPLGTLEIIAFPPRLSAQQTVVASRSISDSRDETLAMQTPSSSRLRGGQSRRRVLTILGVAAASGAIAAAIYGSVQPESDGGSSPVAGTDPGATPFLGKSGSPEPSQPDDDSKPDAVPISEPVDQTASDPATSSSDAEPAADLVVIAIDLAPASTRVRLDGKVVHERELELPRSSAGRTLTFEARGYKRERRHIVADRNKTVRVRLEPIPKQPLYERSLE